MKDSGCAQTGKVLPIQTYALPESQRENPNIEGVVEGVFVEILDRCQREDTKLIPRYRIDKTVDDPA